MFNELKASESQHYLKQRIKVEGRKQRSYLKLMVHERFFWIDVTWLNNHILQLNKNNKPLKFQPQKKKHLSFIGENFISTLNEMASMNE